MTELITSEKSSSNRYSWWIAAFILAAVIVIGNSSLALGKAAPIWDAIDNYAPMFSLVADNAKAFRFLLWNPWSTGGAPDFADPQSGASSPIVMLFGLLAHDPFHAFIAYWISFWIFGGLGMLLLCRHLKCPPWGGLIAALGFVSCGFYTGHGQHTGLIYSFSFIPWIAWRFDVALERSSYWSMAETGLLWGLSALGGYPGIVILDTFFLGLWGLGRVWVASRDCGGIRGKEFRKRLSFYILGLCLTGLIGVAIMSPCYLGFLKYTSGYTFRTGSLSRQRALLEGPLPPQAILTLSSPYLYLLNWPPSSIWPETDLSMGNIYSGVLVAILAFAALLSRRTWRVWLAGIALFFLSCSVGAHLPIRGWVYTLVPPTRFFRFPSLFSAYTIVMLCVLAGLATADLDRIRTAGTSSGRRRFFFISAFVAVAAIWSYLVIVRTAHLTFSSAGRPSRLLLLLWISAVITFFLWWRREISTRLFVAALILLAMYDAGSTFAISWTMYSKWNVAWWNAMSSQHDKHLDLTAKGLTRHMYTADDLGSFYSHNRNLATKSLTFANATGLQNNFVIPYVKDPVLNQILLGSQRIWFSDDPLWLPSDDASFQTYVRVSHALGVPPLVLQEPDKKNRVNETLPAHAAASEEALRSAKPLSPARIDLIAYKPDALEFHYQSDRDGWLLVSDRWAPYWFAEVNGHSVPVLCGNFLFRAVPVTRGDQLVRFWYDPKGYWILLVLSWGTISLVLIGEFSRLPVFRRRRAARAPEFADTLHG